MTAAQTVEEQTQKVLVFFSRDLLVPLSSDSDADVTNPSKTQHFGESCSSVPQLSKLTTEANFAPRKWARI